jgi:hypothetical protein
MDLIRRIFNREPVLFTAVIQSVLTLAVSFGLNMTADQIGTIVAVTAAILGVIARSQVTPVQQ